MRKFIILLLFIFINTLSVQAENLPSNVVQYIKKELPKAEIRFDGLITVDNTLYLPVFPAKFSNVQQIEIKTFLKSFFRF